MIVVLVRGSDRVEVDSERAERIARLLQAGYVIVSKPPESGRQSGPAEERQRRPRPEPAREDDEG